MPIPLLRRGRADCDTASPSPRCDPHRNNHCQRTIRPTRLNPPPETGSSATDRIDIGVHVPRPPTVLPADEVAAQVALQAAGPCWEVVVFRQGRRRRSTRPSSADGHVVAPGLAEGANPLQSMDWG